MLPPIDPWRLTYAYLAGVVVTLVLYYLAWLRQEAPPSRREGVSTMLLAVAWPVLAVWALWAVARSAIRGY